MTLTYFIGVTRHSQGISHVPVILSKYDKLPNYMSQLKMLGRANHVMLF